MNSTYARLVLAFFLTLILHLGTFIKWPSDSYKVSAEKVFVINFESKPELDKQFQEVSVEKVFVQSNVNSVSPSRLSISKKSSSILDSESLTAKQSRVAAEDVNDFSDTPLYYDLKDLDQAAEPEDPFLMDLSGIEVSSDIQMIIEIFISETGHVDKVLFAESINPVIEKVIEREIKQKQFAPAIRQNIKVASRKFIEFAFGP